MIGSHCTFTYLEPIHKIYSLTECWWKTQCKNIIEQYNFGIRFFDIRVCFTKKNRWTLCHGRVNFKYSERTLYDYCLFMASYCPEAIYRIVLEKGDFNDRSIFINEALDLCNKFDNLWRVDIKSYKAWYGYICNNNKKLFDTGYKFALSDPWEEPSQILCLHRSIDGLCDMLHTDLKEEAKGINNVFSFFHNKEELKKVLESKDELWILDYCTNNYR